MENSAYVYKLKTPWRAMVLTILFSPTLKVSPNKTEAKKDPEDTVSSFDI